jgi:hypothetical protein
MRKSHFSKKIAPDLKNDLQNDDLSPDLINRILYPGSYFPGTLTRIVN